MNNEITVKISTHLMPWEIDHANILFDKLRDSLYYVNKDIKIYIHTALNLSDSIIDWEKSKIPKQYFIDRYKAMEYYFKDLCITKFDIYQGSDIWGHLDFQRTCYQDDIDFYICVCPDIDFNEYLIGHMIETAKQITNKYFVLISEIYKCWDYTWDPMVNAKFKDVSYKECFNRNSNEIVKLENPVKLADATGFKFAGWFDLYNKAFYEKLVPGLPEWHGYGPWDRYAMDVCNYAQGIGVDVKEYVLANQVVWFYDSGTLRNENEYGGSGKLKTVYNRYIIKKMNRDMQRVTINSNRNQLLQDWITYYETELKDK
jgi:hypothetical protein